MSAAETYRALLLAAQDSDPNIAADAKVALARLRKASRGGK